MDGVDERDGVDGALTTGAGAAAGGASLFPKLPAEKMKKNSTLRPTIPAKTRIGVWVEPLVTGRFTVGEVRRERKSDWRKMQSVHG